MDDALKDGPALSVSELRNHPNCGKAQEDR